MSAAPCRMNLAAARGRRLVRRRVRDALDHERVGERDQLVAQVPADDVTQQSPQVVLDLGRKLERVRADADAGDQRALQRDRVGHPLGRRTAILRLRAQRRDPPCEPAAARSLRLEQGAQREQAVGQADQRVVALDGQLEAFERPRELPLDGAPPGDQVGERTQLILLRASDHDPTVAAPPAGDRQRTPGGALGTDPGQRCERDARRVEAKRGLEVAQALERIADRARAVARDDRDHRPRTVVTAPAGVGRQHVKPRQRREHHPLRERHLVGLAVDSPQQRQHGELAGLDARPRRQLAVGRLEALGGELEVLARAVEHAAREAAQDVLLDRSPGSVLLGVGVEVLLKAVQRSEGELRVAHLGQLEQPRPVALHELRRQRLVAVQAGSRAARALLHDLEADLVASRNFSGEGRAGRCGKRVQRGVELARLHGGRFVRAGERPPGAAPLAARAQPTRRRTSSRRSAAPSPCAVYAVATRRSGVGGSTASCSAATAARCSGACETSSHNQRRP